MYMEHLATHMRDRHPYCDNKGGCPHTHMHARIHTHTTASFCVGQYKKLVCVDWHPKKSNLALITTIGGVSHPLQLCSAPPTDFPLIHVHPNMHIRAPLRPSEALSSP